MSCSEGTSSSLKWLLLMLSLLSCVNSVKGIRQRPLKAHLMACADLLPLFVNILESCSFGATSVPPLMRKQGMV